MALSRKPVFFKRKVAQPTEIETAQEAQSGDVVPVEHGGTASDTTSGARTSLGVDAAGIKSLYESNADTNEFSDAEQTKLAGIETAAEVNTASNVGNSGVGSFKQKTGTDLEFKKIAAGTGLGVLDDTFNSTVVLSIQGGGVDTTELAEDSVTYAKMQDVSATDRLLGRDTAGAGDVEEITPANVRTMLNVDGALAALDTVSTTEIDNDAVTFAKLEDIATATLLGRVTAATGDTEELTGTQATTLLDAFTSGLKGLAPASGGGTTNFLRADGTWAAPPGGGENNTASNVGTGGVGVFKQKTGDDLEFKKVNAGTGITITDDTGNDEVDVAAADMAANTVKVRNAGTTGVPQDVKISALTEETVPAGGDWLLGENDSGNLVKIDVGDLPTAGGGEINDGLNVGTAGVGVFKVKSGISLHFKKINSGNGITITDDTGNDEVDVAADFGTAAGKVAEGNHTHVEADITDLGAYLENVVEDTTPQLGGDLDINAASRKITNAAEEILELADVASAVNYLKVTNSATGADVKVEATGDDTDVDLDLVAKGSGVVRADGTQVSVLGHTHTLADVTDSGALAALATVDTAQIDDEAVTYAKMQHVSATDRLLGRDTAGAGDVEELTVAAVKTMLNVNGALAALDTVGTSEIDDDAVTLAKMAHISTARLMGRVTAATGQQEQLTGTQATTLLDTFTSSLKGLVPSSGGGTTNFLRADGAWAATPGGGLGNVVEDVTPQLGGDLDANGFDVLFDDNTGIRDSNDNEMLTFQQTASAVNNCEVTNAAAASHPGWRVVGGDTNINLNVVPKGSGTLTVGGTDVSLSGHTHTLADVTDSGALAALATVGTSEIDDEAVTYAKMQHVSATDRLLGRDTAGAGDVEELTTTAVKTMLNVGGALAALSTVGTSEIDNDAVTFAKLENIATSRILGRVTAATGDTEELTATNVRTIINVEDGSNNYSHPNHTGDVTSTGDGAQVIANGAVTNAKAADMAAYTVKLRNAGSSGDPGDVKISALTEETIPAAGDWLLGENQAGTLVKVDVGDLPGGGGGINNVVEDTTPQLGGDLDTNGFDVTFDDAFGIRDDGDVGQLIFQKTTSAVNYFEMQNAATGNDPTLRAVGSDTNVGVEVLTKGTGVVAVDAQTDFKDNNVHFDEHTISASAIDWTDSNKQKKDLTANTTFTFSANPAGPCNLVVKLTQDVGGTNTATWPAACKWASGNAPVLTETGNAVDIITFYYDGTNYYGSALLDVK